MNENKPGATKEQKKITKYRNKKDMLSCYAFARERETWGWEGLISDHVNS